MMEDSMKILVCGGRDYSDAARVNSFLDAMHRVEPVTLLIHGAARGADSLGAAWAKSRGVPTQAFPAQWGRYGRRAGFLRNTEMLEVGKPDLVVAFPGGRGTAHMVASSKDAGVEVIDA
jgi:hypothetical protein